MATTSKVCQQCKEKNNPSFLTCWKCGAPFEQKQKTAPSVKKPSPVKDHTAKYQIPIRPKQRPPIFKFSSSPFCVLGLTASCSSSSILQRVNETKIYSKLGTSPKFIDDIPLLLDSTRSEDSIRESQHVLENPKRRLLEELFWFWDDGEDNKNALKLLTQSKFESAIVALEEASLRNNSSNDGIVAKHNLIVLKHIALLKNESDGKELTKEHWLKWSKILSDWMELIASDALWDYVSNRTKTLYGTNKAELVESTKKCIFEDVLKIQEQLICFYAKNEDIAMVERHAGILSEAKIPLTHYKTLLDSVLAPVESEISGAVSIWNQEFEKNKGSITEAEDVSNFCEQVYKQLIRRLEGSLVLMNALDIQSISDAALAGEGYAEFLRDLAIKLSNEAKRHSQAKMFIKEARRFAVNSGFKNLLDSEIQTLDRLTLAEDLKSGKANELLEQISSEDTNREKVREPANKINKLKAYSVRVKGNQIFVPPECNCCLGKADRKDHVSYEYEVGNKKHTISFELPICNECNSHRLQLNNKILWLVLSTAAIGLTCAFAFIKIFPFISGEFLTILTTIFSSLAYFFLNRFLPFPGVSEPHGSSESSVKMSGGFGIGTFVFSNPAYALLFAAANDSEVHPTDAWRHSRKKIFPMRSKSNIFAIAISACLIIVGLWSVWAATHATLYVDNGYGKTIFLTLNDGQGIFELPNGISTIEVPVANLSAELKRENEVEKLPNLNITSFGDWILNPGRIHSYSRIEIEYGNTSGEPVDRELGNPLLLQVNADYIFERPPKSISTKSGGEIRSVILHSESAPTVDVPEGLEGLKASLEQRQSIIEKEDLELEEMATRIDNYKKRASEIESMGNVEGGLLDEYNLIIEKANKDIKEYNPRLVKINQMKEKFSADVKRYNSQIKD